jgi:hypothetical protein
VDEEQMAAAEEGQKQIRHGAEKSSEGWKKTPDRAGNVGPEWIYNFHAMNWNF